MNGRLNPGVGLGRLAPSVNHHESCTPVLLYMLQLKWDFSRAVSAINESWLCLIYQAKLTANSKQPSQAGE